MSSLFQGQKDPWSISSPRKDGAGTVKTVYPMAAKRAGNGKME